MLEASLILHDIRSAENVGSIFRTADAAGASRVYLTGYTPAPIDRFGRRNGKIAKAALGAEQSVPWERATDPLSLIRTLKERGVRIIAVEQDARSVPYDSFRMEAPFALVLGNEISGVPEEILSTADTIIEIPMRGTKESLNVAVAAGIALYRLLGNSLSNFNIP